MSSNSTESTPQTVSSAAGHSTETAIDGIGPESLNLPNAITVSRLVLAAVLFYLIREDAWWLTAMTVFMVAAGTDFIDGYLARRFGQVTTLGRILDPFVDKIIICGSFVFLLEKQGHHDAGVNAWMVVVVIGREMFVSGLRGFLEKLGLDFSADISGKAKMVVQCAAVTVALLSLSPAVADWKWLVPTRDVLLWLAVAVTAWSGLAYVFRASRLLQSAARQSESDA